MQYTWVVQDAEKAHYLQEAVLGREQTPYACCVALPAGALGLWAVAKPWACQAPAHSPHAVLLQAGSCTALGLAELPAVESKGGFSKRWVPLAEFAGAQGSASGGGARFGGCGGMGVWDLNSLEFRSVDGAAQTLCVSSIRLLP